MSDPGAATDVPVLSRDDLVAELEQLHRKEHRSFNALVLARMSPLLAVVEARTHKGLVTFHVETARSELELRAAIPSTADEPPVVKITNPLNGTKVSGNVKVMVSASDNAGTSGIRQVLYMNGKSVATSNGGTLNFGWNASKAAVGSYTFKAVATDAAGNASSTSVTVTR